VSAVTTNGATAATRGSVDAGVSEAGVWLTAKPDIAVDVLVAGQRIWSFNPRRDTVRRQGAWHAAWPSALAPFMQGRGQIMMREHVSGQVLFDGEVRLGDGDEPLQVVDAQGHPLSIS